MSKMICSRAVDRFQVCENGLVRMCGWSYDQTIGNLLENTVEEIYLGEAAIKYRERHLNHDYSLCMPDACQYQRTGMEEILVPYEEKKFPGQLCLAFERTCNYDCLCCSHHNWMEKNKGRDMEPQYQLIEDRLREVLPYAKSISANGLGELFAGKHTLNLLSSWRPLAKAEDCRVELETNGVLFDEKHWSQIENLGQYKLSVFITVMSFNESVYQYLSGCSYPIKKLEDSLNFVRTLREKNIIDYLELATVLQEHNFREMPDFITRCIEEFGADKVRLRPYQPWNNVERADVAWFKDVRVEDHPLHGEYKKMLEMPIFNDPHVLNYGIKELSDWTRKSPYAKELENEEMMSEIVIHPEILIKKIKNKFGEKPIVVYGMEVLGKFLSKVLHDNGYDMPYILAYQKDCESFFGKDVICYKDIPEAVSKNVGVIITPLHAIKRIRYDLGERGYSDMISIKELWDEF